jgi:hypothetical protein
MLKKNLDLPHNIKIKVIIIPFISKLKLLFFNEKKYIVFTQEVISE